jgi:hypothetical protein
MVFFDLAKSARRKGNWAWVFYALLAISFVVLTVLWLVFRGDIHSEEWFLQFSAFTKTLF